MARTGLLWVAAAVIATVVSGCSETGGVGAGGAGATVGSNDEFVRDVATKHMAGIELSRMALDRAVAPSVKVFAQQMIDDHTAALSELKSLASGHSIGWPGQLEEKHRETADELAREQGADFDDEYLEAMVDGFRDLAAKLESRLDVQSLSEWKTAAAARTQNKAMPQPDIAMRDVEVRPGESSDGITAKINQWAADTYPLAQKHLDTATMLKNAAERASIP